MAYHDVVFLQGDDANEALTILDEQGLEQALDYLAQWYYPGEHSTRDEDPSGSSDSKFWDAPDETGGQFLMVWNSRLGYIGLYYVNGE